eukprot:1496109-Pyramimonas_sp.AAC.1
MHLVAKASPTAFPSARAYSGEVIEDSDSPTFEAKLVPKDERWAPQRTKELSAADRFLGHT